MPRPLPPILRSMPCGWLGALVLIMGVEGWLAAHPTHFSAMEPDLWRLARERAERPPAGGVLILGDSQVELGISPLTVESRLGQPVECLAIPGGQAPSSYLLLRAALGAGAIPSAIVVDFEPNLLQRNRDPNRRMWSDLATLGESLDLAWTLGDLHELAEMLSAKLLISWRQRVDICPNLIAALRGETPPKPEFITATRRNRGMNQGALMMAKQAPGRFIDDQIWVQAARRPWSPHPSNEVYVHRLLDLANEHQIPVFCALMPVVPHLRASAASSGFEASYCAWLRGLQARHPNLRVLDWRSAGYPESVFFDALHLDAEGAASVGDALAEYLRRFQRGEARAERWVAMPGLRSDGSYLALEDHARSTGIVRTARDAGRVQR